MGTVVVYVHGLWFSGGESMLLRRRLAHSLHADTRVFRYASVGAGWEANAAALAGYLDTVRADTLHLVAHSMGGLLVLKLFEGGGGGVAERLPPGRIVLTGSPVRGSESARKFARAALGRRLLGRMAMETLAVRREPRWSAVRDLGVIAGDLDVGLGRLLGRLDGPNDGTVLVEETQLPGAAAQIQLPVSHTGLVFAASVARQVAAFLQDGRFAA